VKIITIDIETIAPNWIPGAHGYELIKTPVAIDGGALILDEKPKFPPLPYHLPVVISVLSVDTATPGEIELTSYRLDEISELHVLVELALRLSDAHRIVTYNGRGFDMPLLTLRAMAQFALGNKIDWSFWEQCRHRFGNYKQALVHYDLADQLTDFGGAPRFGLDALAQAMGLPGKVGVEGSQVGRLWEDPSNRDRIVMYCESDVIDTFLCYAFWDSIFLFTPGIEEIINEMRLFLHTDDFLSERYAAFIGRKASQLALPFPGEQ
jgi:predicted PolB exonuclease-like 3'-5' exonuclease